MSRCVFAGGGLPGVVGPRPARGYEGTAGVKSSLLRRALGQPGVVPPSPPVVLWGPRRYANPPSPGHGPPRRRTPSPPVVLWGPRRYANPASPGHGPPRRRTPSPPAALREPQASRAITSFAGTRAPPASYAHEPPCSVEGTAGGVGYLLRWARAPPAS